MINSTNELFFWLREVVSPSKLTGGSRELMIEIKQEDAQCYKVCPYVRDVHGKDLKRVIHVRAADFIIL